MLWCMQAVLTIIEVTGSFWWVGLFYPEKQNIRQRKLLFVAGTSTMVVLTIIRREIAMYSRWYLLFCIVFCSLICFVWLGRRSSVLFMMAFYYETVYCLDLLLSILAGYVLDNPDFMLEQQFRLRIGRILVFLAARGIGAVLFLVLYLVKDKWFVFLWGKWWYAVPLFEHLILFMCDAVLTPGQQLLGYSRARGIIAINVLLILILGLLYISNMKKSVSELVEMQKSLYARSYENIVQRRLERERITHDTKNHLLTLQGLIRSGQTERAEDYIDHLCDSFASSREYTGSQIIDYLISEKADCAERLGIQVTPDCGNLPQSRSGQEDMDWTAVLGNLWDNAIESCERCAGEKQITFGMRQQGNIILVHMENSCPPSAGRTGLKTLKNPDELHGIGMRSIRYVVSKYHGVLKWEYKENSFITDITMYL